MSQFDAAEQPDRCARCHCSDCAGLRAAARRIPLAQDGGY